MPVENNIQPWDYEITDSDDSDSDSNPEDPAVVEERRRRYRPGDEIDNTDEMYNFRVLEHNQKRRCLSERIDEVESGDSNEAVVVWPDEKLSDPWMDQLHSNGDAKTPRKKLKLNPASERLFWLKKNVLPYPEMTLSERSAKSLAASWSDANEVEAQMRDLDESLMTLVFKAEVAVHLKGHLLAAFLRREGGLDPLMRECWPEVFQRLLTAVYHEIARFNQESGARQALSRCVRLLRETVEKRETFHPAVHRLGLTGSYEQPHLADPDEWCLYEYYKKQDERCFLLQEVPMLHYPLPHALRGIDTAATSVFVTTCYELVLPIRRRQQTWRDEASPLASNKGVIERENQGLALSDWTADFRRQSYSAESPWLDSENLSVFRRHLLLLQSITSTHLNGSYQAVIVLSLLALTDPFYNSSRMTFDNRQRAPLLRPLRADIFRFLARSLSFLYADLDLPLACLHMMKKISSEMLPRQCLGDRGRLVLTQMEILVRYGFHRQARDLFWQWFGRFPSTSWIHEELVLIYTTGALNVIQEELMELKLTLLLHYQCKDAQHQDLGCWKKHVVPLLRSTKTKLLLLKSIMLRCLSDLTLREDFRRDCNNALSVCQFYLLIHKKVDAQDCTTNDGHFNHLYYRLRWNDVPKDASFLRAFLWTCPRDVSRGRDWITTKRQELDQNLKQVWIQACHMEAPRAYADLLFTYLTGSLFFDSLESNRQLIEETETAYIKSTAGRHHRVALLTRLLVVHDDLEGAFLPVDPSVDFSDKEIKRLACLPFPAPSIVHPTTKQEHLTGALTAQRRIDEFSVDSLRDALHDFRKCDLSSDEKFVAYLRRRDSLMDVHLDVGLRVLRFAKNI